VFERFFDESGGMQFVIHSPFGSRINRAVGLALRKRFCRKFNFELQAAATEDAIVLSLSTSHSFPLDEVARYLIRRASAAAHPGDVRCADVRRAMALGRTTSLALPRFRSGKKVPPQLAAHGSLRTCSPRCFPTRSPARKSGWSERASRSSARQPDGARLPVRRDGHRGARKSAAALESGEIRIESRELTEPSPLALEILGARPVRVPRRCAARGAPHARGDEPPLARRGIGARLGRLDTAAIDRVRAEAWPTAENADELHDALLGVAFVTEAEVARNEPWQQFLATLMEAKRVTKLVPHRPIARPRGRPMGRSRAPAAVLPRYTRAPVFRRRSPLPRIRRAYVGAADAALGRSSAVACRGWGR
jgi:ATP-dependent Lhr-like helicase